MIKFTAKNVRGQDVVGLGLSRANCERLLAGEPILVPLDELVPGATIEVLVFAGETEQAMYDHFQRAGRLGPHVKKFTMHPDDPHAR